VRLRLSIWYPFKSGLCLTTEDSPSETPPYRFDVSEVVKTIVSESPSVIIAVKGAKFVVVAAVSIREIPTSSVLNGKANRIYKGGGVGRVGNVFVE
jgi:hypothetical protein